MLKSIRVIVADDTDIAREGMKRILAAEADIEVVAEGKTVHETIQKVHDMHPDILLLDLKWFGDESAGIDAIKRLTAEVRETKIIAITVYPHLIKLAKDAGASGALEKEIPKERLIETVRSVYALPLPPPPAKQEMPMEELTHRELEVLVLMAEGMTDKEIADKLGIAESTAKNHVSNILKKLNVPNRAGAVAAGYEFEFIGTKRT